MLRQVNNKHLILICCILLVFSLHTRYLVYVTELLMFVGTLMLQQEGGKSQVWSNNVQQHRFSVALLGLLFRSTRTVLYMHISARLETELDVFPVILSFPLSALSTICKSFLSCLRLFLPVNCVPPQQAVSRACERSGDLAGHACGPKRCMGYSSPLLAARYICILEERRPTRCNN